MAVIDEIAAERQRQMGTEGWTIEHDDEHEDGSLAAAAACYAYFASLPNHARRDLKDGDTRLGTVNFLGIMWPRSWHWQWWKPKERRRDLVRAGALIVAEIERLDRAASAKKTAWCRRMLVNQDSLR